MSTPSNPHQRDGLKTCSSRWPCWCESISVLVEPLKTDMSPFYLSHLATPILSSFALIGCSVVGFIEGKQYYPL